jgi:serine protease Do
LNCSKLARFTENWADRDWVDPLKPNRLEGDRLIMSRTSTSLACTAALSAGLILGISLDRGVRPLTAQTQAVAAPGGGESHTTPASHLPAPRLSGSEDAIYQELDRQYEQFYQVNRTFELVSKAVSPAVVHIVSRKLGRAREDDPTPYYEESGSGVMVRPQMGKGVYVLTNNHVIEGAIAPDVNIVLQDGRVLHPLRYWSDRKADVAVLSLGRDDLPTARLGNSDDAPVGTWVLALGSPFGLTHSVSQGIISARGRHEDELEKDGYENQDFLQTDAAINPGNSGGPLVNLKGEVIGINTAIASNGGGSEGVGFSIPIKLAKWIMVQLVTNGKVSRGGLGIDLPEADMLNEQALALGLDRPRGAWIKSVFESSPASEAGLRKGDVVLRFDGMDVVNQSHLINLVSMTEIGRTVEVVIWRDRKELVKKVRIADKETLTSQAPASSDRQSPNGFLRRAPRPAQPGGEVSESSAQVLGLELLTLDGPAVARRMHVAETARGVVVVRVEPTSPLALYCKPRDVITSIDGHTVRTAEEAAQLLNHRPSRAAIELSYQRLINGSNQLRTVRIPR